MADQARRRWRGKRCDETTEPTAAAFTTITTTTLAMAISSTSLLTPVLAEELDPIGHLIEKDKLFVWDLPDWLWQDWMAGGAGMSKPVIYMIFSGALCCLIFIRLAKTWEPVPRTFLQKFFEPLLVFVRDDLVYDHIHDRKLADKLLPFFWTLFFFVLMMNVIGLTPWSVAASGQFSVTAALAVISFFMIVGLGMRKQGPVTYIKNLVPHGLPFFVIPLVFVIEVVGLFTKPFALAIRLFANMTGGHLIIFVALSFCVGANVLPGQLAPGESANPVGYGVAALSVIAAAVITGFEIIIALVQAYIFTLLTALFVGMAIDPDH